MIYTKLGKSDLNVSHICMGCMGIGDPSKGMNKWAVPEEESSLQIESQAEIREL